MKRLIVLGSWLCMCWLSFASSISINGASCPIDTLENYIAGPGTTYTRFNVTISGKLHKMYLLTVDLTNPYNKLEEYQAQDHLGATERMDAAHQKIDSVGHHPIGSVNCNFWCVSSNINSDQTLTGLLGQPFAGTAKDGMLITEPMNWNIGHGNRGYVMIDDMKRAYIRNLEFKGRVYKDGQSAVIRDVNRGRVYPNANEICLFNRYCTNTRSVPDSVLEVVFDVPAGWSVNDTLSCVVKSLNHRGGTALSGNMGALQARGARSTWCTNHLAVGDTFQIKLGMYATSITEDDVYSGDSLAPHIMQMVTGNCLVMANGVLTSRNTNEGYNNQNYPRTMLATNNDGSRFWMLVSQSPGNYTAEMCEILRYDGATWAAGMDGGGSAQMNLYGTIVNPTTEATPRAVANAMFVVSTAPDDPIPGTLRFVNSAPTTVASYASYTPTIRAYNRYDALLTHDFHDYTLSCEPSSLGTISADGRTFIAAAIPGEGVLVAHYGDVTARKCISVLAGAVSLRLDSLWTDSRPYSIEVLSSTADASYSVHPSHLSWTVDDPLICSVDEQGVLRGLSNGCTIVHGQLADYSMDMAVTVSLAEQPVIVADSMFSAMDNGWSCKTSSGTVDIDTHSGAHVSDEYTLNYTSSRGAYLQLSKDLTVYGCPDSMLITVYSELSPISLTCTMLAHNTAKAEKITCQDTIDLSQPYTYRIPLNEVADITDLASYPLSLSSLRWTWQNIKAKTAYRFSLRQLAFVYGQYILTDMVSTPSAALQIFPNPTTDIVYIKSTAGEAVLYDMSGHALLKSSVSGQGCLHVGALPAGMYIIRVGDSSATLVKR